MAEVAHSYERLEDEVLHLPRTDRSELATRLLESLEEDDFEVSPAWKEELQRRVEDLDAGRAGLIRSDDLWKEINQRFGTSL